MMLLLSFKQLALDFSHWLFSDIRRIWCRRCWWWWLEWRWPLESKQLWCCAFILAQTWHCLFLFVCKVVVVRQALSLGSYLFLLLACLLWSSIYYVSLYKIKRGNLYGKTCDVGYKQRDSISLTTTQLKLKLNNKKYQTLR